MSFYSDLIDSLLDKCIAEIKILRDLSQSESQAQISNHERRNRLRYYNRAINTLYTQRIHRIKISRTRQK